MILLSVQKREKALKIRMKKGVFCFPLARALKEVRFVDGSES